LLPTVKRSVRPPLLMDWAAGFLGQRDADDGQPVVLLLDHQHRFAVDSWLSALARGPRSTTATPPGTGLFSRRVM
jgi:hypothetical protein